MTAAVEAEGLRKRYGRTRALAGLDLTVETGSVHGVLGPNGAGKTTAVRILTTLLRADGGRARVLGLDVQRDAQKLRAQIGLTGQYAAVDEYLTGLENLDMFGRLYRLPARIARLRAAELLERFDLVEAGRRPVKTYSGGMRRRLDLAASLVMQPKLLFLDEPTTGLDPRSRLSMWEVIAELVRDGTTVLLTTQYLEEADRLANTISVIDGGKVIAEGTADDLKKRVGGDRLTVLVGPGGDLGAAVEVLRRHALDSPTTDLDRWAVTISAGAQVGMLPAVVRDLDLAGVPVADVEVTRPTLDDVFLSLTGKAAERAPAPPPPPPDYRPTEPSPAADPVFPTAAAERPFQEPPAPEPSDTGTRPYVTAERPFHEPPPEQAYLTGEPPYDAAELPADAPLPDWLATRS